MARGVNKVILIGNLGADPETRYSQGGDAITKCSIATSETWRDKQSGEQQERTEWHNLTFFKRQAEIAGEYLRKGSKVYIEGSLRTSNWEKDGQKHYKTEIVVREMQMLDGRRDGDEPRAPSSGADEYRKASGGSSRPPAPPQDDEFVDDIPF